MFVQTVVASMSNRSRRQFVPLVQESGSHILIHSALSVCDNFAPSPRISLQGALI